MSVDTVTTNGRATPDTVPQAPAGRDDDALPNLAVRHLELVRKFKLSLLVYGCRCWSSRPSGSSRNTRRRTAG